MVVREATLEDLNSNPVREHPLHWVGDPMGKFSVFGRAFGSAPKRWSDIKLLGIKRNHAMILASGS